VEALLFSRDGRALITAGGDRAVRVWDLAGRAVVQLEGHRNRVRTLALSPDGRTLASGSDDGTVLVWRTGWPQRRPAPPEARLTADEKADLWLYLSSPNSRTGHWAALRLLRAPDAAVALLRERLRPAAAPAGRRIDRLIADLDSDEFHQREKARQALAKHGDSAEPAMRLALTGRSSAEVRDSALRLLERLEKRRASPERLRTLRAVWVMEQIGTVETRRLLERLAGGAPDDLLSRQARASLRRLKEFRRP
jgi:hypothetical protein